MMHARAVLKQPLVRRLYITVEQGNQSLMERSQTL